MTPAVVLPTGWDDQNPDVAYNLTASEGFAVADLSTAKQRRYLECLAALRGTSLTDEERFVRASASARISQLKQELQGHT